MQSSKWKCCCLHIEERVRLSPAVPVSRCACAVCATSRNCSHSSRMRMRNRISRKEERGSANPRILSPMRIVLVELWPLAPASHGKRRRPRRCPCGRRRRPRRSRARRCPCGRRRRRRPHRSPTRRDGEPLGARGGAKQRWRAGRGGWAWRRGWRAAAVGHALRLRSGRARAAPVRKNRPCGGPGEWSTELTEKRDEWEGER